MSKPKADEITPAQKSWLIAYLNRFENVLYGPNFKGPGPGLRRIHRHRRPSSDNHWILELTKKRGRDSFSSNYCRRGPGGKIKMEPIWDWDLSFRQRQWKARLAPQNLVCIPLGDSEYLWFRAALQPI